MHSTYSRTEAKEAYEANESKDSSASLTSLASLASLIASIFFFPLKTLAIDLGGADEITSIPGDVGTGSIRQSVRDVLFTILSYVGLAAVVVIIIAGLYLIFSLGEESRRETATKIIIYAAIGILVIGLSAAFVNVFTRIFT